MHHLVGACALAAALTGTIAGALSIRLYCISKTKAKAKDDANTDTNADTNDTNAEDAEDMDCDLELATLHTALRNASDPLAEKTPSFLKSAFDTYQTDQSEIETMEEDDACIVARCAVDRINAHLAQPVTFEKIVHATKLIDLEWVEHIEVIISIVYDVQYNIHIGASRLPWKAGRSLDALQTRIKSAILLRPLS